LILSWVIPKTSKMVSAEELCRG